MRMTGDLARGGHQAHWGMQYEASIIRTPWRLRLWWAVKDAVCPRQPADSVGRVLPGQAIHKIGTGYHEAMRPGWGAESCRRTSASRWRSGP